ncbi:predicted protein [Pyrenophora tritici-repentis Pt-1C-BFP]|uniref:Uncharacterized protein n=1 Tax=Pyrenophora tritici-repentis (strain Pt-1C-BFP) TaxID=426418 RepID=B2W6M6_PYRTR|nr:uncharacterized protein PTRG_05464 [Pyrenophora tritici-repentis Pt-1C-BFP]EDU48384.1 predicted protein [Pyrenophora tritici-repentis Pt-1C-BFP]
MADAMGPPQAARAGSFRWTASTSAGPRCEPDAVAAVGPVGVGVRALEKVASLTAEAETNTACLPLSAVDVVIIFTAERPT